MNSIPSKALILVGGSILGVIMGSASVQQTASATQHEKGLPAAPAKGVETKPAPRGDARSREGETRPPWLAGVLGGATRHWDAVRAVAFSPDGKALIVGSDDGNLTLHDPRTAEARRVLPRIVEKPDRINSYAGAMPFALAFRPDNGLLAAACSDKSVKLWTVAGWKKGDDLTQAHTDAVFASASHRMDGLSSRSRTTTRRGSGTRPPARCG